MKLTICLLCYLLLIVELMAQEMTIPVGINGQDTLTRINIQDTEGNYDVGYNENQLTGGASFYREKGFANGTRQGSYGYTTRNGLIRIVTYVADKDGYRAEVLTNEPGIEAVNPSNVTVTKEKEPDPEALARGPTGSESAAQSSVIYSSASNVMRNYIPASQSQAQPVYPG
ncbi:Cuticle protein 14 isoform b, partial [Stegodyphus mimosarum]